MEAAIKSKTIDNKPKARKHLSRRGHEIIFITLMLALPILQFVIFWIIPNFSSIVMGFQNKAGDFNNFENFTRFFKEVSQPNGELINAIKNSLIFAAVNIFISTPLVIFFSYVLFRRVPLSGIFRVVFYLPSILGVMVTAELFKMLFMSGGPMFEALKSIGWISKEVATVGLFSHPDTAFLMVIIYSLWTCVGMNMIMFNGAMKRIPQEIFESAEIDGVGFFRQFINIVVPLIWPTIATLIVFSLSGIFVSYGAVMILTPDTRAASMIGWFIVKYTTATDSQASLQYPAAVGLIFTAFGLPFVLLVRWALNKIGKNVEY